MFGKGSDLQYQDEIHGSLFIQADRVIELIYLKYLKASISYDKEIRIETWPFPREGNREAVYNAIIHCNRAAHIPIQIRIEENAMYISNDCIFPQGWTAETLMERHRSEPYNPDIANAFFRAGYVETWGRGIQKICEACKDNGNPMPEYKLHPGDIMVKFIALNILKHQKEVLKDVLGDALEGRIILGLKQNNKIKQSDLAEYLGVSLPSIQRAMKRLTVQGRIKRKGGKRFGHWEIND